MVVVYVVPIGLDVRPDRLTDPLVQRDYTFALALILQDRSRFWPVDELDRLLFAIEVAEIQRSKATESRAGVPRRFEQRVPSTPVHRVGRAVVPDQRERAVGRQPRFAGPFAAGNVRNVHPVGKIVVDGLDSFKVFDEVLQRLHLVVERRRGDVLPGPVGLVLVEDPAVQVSNRLDPVVFAPLGEEFQPVVVRRRSFLCQLCAATVEVTVPGFAWREFLRFNHSRSPPLRSAIPARCSWTLSINSFSSIAAADTCPTEVICDAPVSFIGLCP